MYNVYYFRSSTFEGIGNLLLLTLNKLIRIKDIIVSLIEEI